MTHLPPFPRFILTLTLVGLMTWLGVAQVGVTKVNAASPSPTASPKTSPKASVKPSPTASPDVSPAPSASDSSLTTQKLKERIEKVIEEKRDQVKGVLSDLSAQRRGFVAEVQRITNESITIKSKNDMYILPVDDSMAILKKGQLIAKDNLAVGDWVIAIGNDDDNTFKPERLVVSATPLKKLDKNVILGTIKTFNKAKTELEIQPRSKDTTTTVSLTKTTKYEDIDGNPLVLKDVTVDTAALVVTLTDAETSTLKATRIRLLGTSTTNDTP